jgi:hypothetical protein
MFPGLDEILLDDSLTEDERNLAINKLNLPIKEEIKHRARHIKNLESDVIALKEHNLSIDERIKKIASRIDNDKSVINSLMRDFNIIDGKGKHSIKDEYMRITTYISAHKVDTDINSKTGETKLPSKFVNKVITCTYSADKKAILGEAKTPIRDKKTGAITGYKYIAPAGATITPTWTTKITT